MWETLRAAYRRAYTEVRWWLWPEVWLLSIYLPPRPIAWWDAMHKEGPVLIDKTTRRRYVWDESVKAEVERNPRWADSLLVFFRQYWPPLSGPSPWLGGVSRLIELLKDKQV